MSFGLAAFLTRKSLVHHRTIAIITIAGVSIGMSVMATILVVDHNTRRAESHLQRRLEKPRAKATSSPFVPPIERFTMIPASPAKRAKPSVSVPTQRGEAVSVGAGSDESRLGEEDYQAMRLAVRTASLLAFAIGTVVVFYTMRFSVSARSREFALIRCLGAHRGEMARSLVFEAAILGGVGTLLGLLAAIPIGATLLRFGITTTGRSSVAGFDLPGQELALFALIGMVVALAGVFGPARSLLRLDVRDVLEPRFLAEDAREGATRTPGLIWLLLPIALAAYLVSRPFLQAWFTVFVFFVVESVVAVGFAVAVLWWVKPVLRAMIRLGEHLLHRVYPLESLLTARHMSFTSDRLAFSVIAVVLVFSMLTALHSITAALKYEIEQWAQLALYPYTFSQQRGERPLDAEAITKLEDESLAIFRLSKIVNGVFPIRLIDGGDLNRFRVRQGKEIMGPGEVILSSTLANHFGAKAGDRLEIVANGEPFSFSVLEVSDEYGFYPQSNQYINLRSFALFTDGNPLFEGNLERTLGRYAAMRRLDGDERLDADELAILAPYYEAQLGGGRSGRRQKREIDRDFLIFDYILAMTVLLSAIGIVNAMLIQIRARSREFSLYRVVGMTPTQVARLLVIEGMITGGVGGALALVLGSLLGAISVAFLDRFTLFSLDFVMSPVTLVVVFLGAVFVNSVSALYPARKATQISSAESLHYE